MSIFASVCLSSLSRSEIFLSSSKLACVLPTRVAPTPDSEVVPVAASGPEPAAAIIPAARALEPATAAAPVAEVVLAPEATFEASPPFEDTPELSESLFWYWDVPVVESLD